MIARRLVDKVKELGVEAQYGSIDISVPRNIAPDVADIEEVDLLSLIHIFHDYIILRNNEKVARMLKTFPQRSMILS